MNFIEKISKHSLLLPIIFLTLCLSISNLIRVTLLDVANSRWQDQARQQANWLSSTTLGWLSESYSALSGMAVLYENSENVSEEEFFHAYDSIETRSSAYFLDEMMIIKLHDEYLNKLSVLSLSNPSGALSPGQDVSGYNVLKLSINNSQKRFGQVVLSPPFVNSMGDTISYAVLMVHGREGDLAVVGLLNFSSILNSLHTMHMPDGMFLRILGRFVGVESSDEALLITESDHKAEVFSSIDRTVSGNTDITLHWGVSSDFHGGVNHYFTNVAFLLGIIISFLFSFIVFIFISQNKKVVKKVKQATQELRLSTERFEALFYNSPTPMIITDNGKFLDCNFSVLKLLGYSSKQEFLN